MGRLQEIEAQLELELLEYFMTHIYFPGDPMDLDEAVRRIRNMAIRAVERARKA